MTVCGIVVRWFLRDWAHFIKGMRHESYLVEIRHLLLEAGCHAIFAPKTLQGLGMDLKRVARYAQRVSTNAWIVQAGTREILQWFADRPEPAFAIFGAFSGLPISAIGPLKIPAMIRAVRRLVALGHRRIVMLSRMERLQPKPALFERMFLKEPEAHGIETGHYNLPIWENTSADFHRCLGWCLG